VPKPRPPPPPLGRPARLRPTSAPRPWARVISVARHAKTTPSRLPAGRRAKRRPRESAEAGGLRAAIVDVRGKNTAPRGDKRAPRARGCAEQHAKPPEHLGDAAEVEDEIGVSRGAAGDAPGRSEEDEVVGRRTRRRTRRADGARQHRGARRDAAGSEKPRKQGLGREEPEKPLERNGRSDMRHG